MELIQNLVTLYVGSTIRKRQVARKMVGETNILTARSTFFI